MPPELPIDAESATGASDSARTGDPELQRTVMLAGVDLASFLGHRDQLIADLEAQHPEVTFHARDQVLTLRGPAGAVRSAEEVVEEILELARRSGAVTRRDVQEVTRMVHDGQGPTAAQMLSEPIVSVRGHAVRAQTRGQRAYVDAIDSHTIVFGVGPAGTGKTYLAMAKAVQALQRREVAKIILTRPAVEAGERLGYLPGTLEDKIDPYLRPLFDAIGSMMDADVVPKLLASGTIEVAPLAYMRGRTLNESFVVLDEAQNTTPEQMKMFLTRLGFGSRIVVTGDVTQVDLPGATKSGLRQVQHVLGGIDDIAFCELTSADVVRHELVGEIVAAYDQFDTTNRHRVERARRKEDRRAARPAHGTAEAGPGQGSAR